MPRPLLPRVLAIDPVLDRLADTSCSSECGRLGCDRAIAERLATTRRTVQRWKHDGLTVELAERIADRLRAHPAEVWGACAYNLAVLHAEDFLEGALP